MKVDASVAYVMLYAAYNLQNAVVLVNVVIRVSYIFGLSRVAAN